MFTSTRYLPGSILRSSSYHSSDTSTAGPIRTNTPEVQSSVIRKYRTGDPGDTQTGQTPKPNIATTGGARRRARGGAARNSLTHGGDGQTEPAQPKKTKQGNERE